MSLDIHNVPTPISNEPAVNSQKPAWHKASSKNVNSYASDLNDKILNISIPEDLLSCRNTKCKNQEHIDNCDKYCFDILEAISESVKDNIPLTGKNNEKKVVAGWSANVKYFQNEARFYHALWLSNGNQNNTQLHWAIKKLPDQFHYLVRRANRNEETIRNNKFVQSCL